MKALLFFILLPFLSFAQSKEDSKVIVTLSDTTGLYQKVKIALVKNDFIVKEDGNQYTLLTYSREIGTLPGYSVVKAAITGNTVTLTGVYGLKHINDWGYTESPKKYTPIVYFKGSKGWKILTQIADAIGGTVTYLK